MTLRIALTLIAASLVGAASPHGASATRELPASKDTAAAPLEIAAGMHRDVALAAGDSVGLVLVWGGDAVVAGTARAVVVVDGNARLLPSARAGQVFVARGVAELEDGSLVAGDVHLLDATVRLAPDASLRGEVLQSRWSRIASGLRTFGILVGIGISIALLLGANIAVAIAPVAVHRVGETLKGQVGLTLLCAGLLWLLLPWLALQLAATIVGLPIGLGYLVFVLPTLGFMGFLVSAVALGDALSSNALGSAPPAHPYRSATLGVGLLLVVGLIPVVGAIVSALAAIVGSGALVLAAGGPVERRTGRRHPSRPILAAAARVSDG